MSGNQPADPRQPANTTVLRQLAARQRREGLSFTPTHIESAADEIESLRAERDQLHTELAEAREQLASAHRVHEFVQRQHVETFADRERLRAQVQAACLHGYEGDQHYPHDGECDLPTWREIVQLREKLRAAALVPTNSELGDVK